LSPQQKRKAIPTKNRRPAAGGKLARGEGRSVHRPLADNPPFSTSLQPPWGEGGGGDIPEVVPFRFGDSHFLSLLKEREKKGADLQTLLTSNRKERPSLFKEEKEHFLVRLLLVRRRSGEGEMNLRAPTRKRKRRGRWIDPVCEDGKKRLATPSEKAAITNILLPGKKR